MPFKSFFGFLLTFMNLIGFHHIQSLVPLWPDTIGMTKKYQTLTHFIMWHRWKIQYLWLNF